MTTEGEDTGKETGVERAPTLRETVRSIAHDINGALNNLALNVELLDRTTAAGGDPDAAEASRARSLSSARRAIRELQELVERRILPLGGPPKPDPGAKV